MTKTSKLVLIALLCFSAACTKEKIVTVTVDGNTTTQKEENAVLVPTTLTELLSFSNSTQGNTKETYLKIKKSLEDKLSNQYVMPDEEIEKLLTLLLDSKKSNPISFLNSLFEIKTNENNRSTLELAQNLFENINSKSPLSPSLKLVNRDRLLLQFLRSSLTNNDFETLMDSNEAASFLSSHIKAKTFVHYGFLNDLVNKRESLDNIFRPALQTEIIPEFSTFESCALIDRLLPLWAESSDNLITDRQLQNIITWYKSPSKGALEESLFNLDAINKIFEKSFSSFENKDPSQYRENVINRQIFLNMTSKLKKEDHLLLSKLSFNTLLSLAEQTDTPDVLQALKKKKEELVTKLKSSDSEDRYHAALAELQYAKVELLYAQNKTKEIKLSLTTTLKEKWLSAYQAYTNDFSKISWGSLKGSELFEDEKPVLDSGILVIDLSGRSEELNERLLSPGIFKADRDVVIKAENLFFHPLTLILANGKNIEINAKKIYAPFIETSGTDAGINQISCAKYNITSLPTQSQWGDGGDINWIQSLPSCDQLRNEHRNSFEGINVKEVQEYNFSISPDDKNLFNFLNTPRLDFDGLNASSAGNITLKTDELFPPVLLASGGNGGNGNDGCDAKKFADQTYQKNFKRGQISTMMLVGSYRRNNGDGYDDLEQDVGYCQEPQSSYSSESLSLHRVEAGSGGSAGHGADVVVTTKNIPTHFSVINTAGAIGKKGNDAQGPSQENRRPKDGALGKDGITLINEKKV